MEELKFTIYAPPRTKKNHAQITYKGGYPRLLPSKAYMEFEKASKPFCPNMKICCPINLKAVFYMESRRKVDLANLLNAIDDVLVVHGTLEDDNRNIVYSHNGSVVLWDKNNPRVEITITPIESEDFEEWKS